MSHKPVEIMIDNLVAENIFFSVMQRDILKGVTIRADKGKVTGLLGRNGSGKSTMLQAMFGTLSVQECNVFVNGQMVKNAYGKAGLVNYLPRKPYLPGRLKVADALKQFGSDVAYILLWFPEVEEDLEKRINELSGGRERLWSVLILLLANTRFTLLDEPFTHIMPIHIERLKELISIKKVDKGIIITDHMYRHLLEISNSLYLMKDGKSIYIRDKQDLVLHGYLSFLESD
ncbi:ABC transporter ATP-binding protein [Flavipsychrobacter stenotrophus]|uniref:ABC transporter ATP-binding protein n=1 Tax=Flavipsychrobacter stenotrophus TaxID=2077091 RepID=A0A2S7SRE9_9BACT|nr:ABC transporter ATP-binding protein [Flavipsychrobacter stenotrophus]PQJ09324.1 ABC transporter ATP-binding protein [Flavipsychrobacter stenotrophus]